MGLCFSKKKPPATPAGGAKKPGKIAVAVADDKVKKTAQQPNKAAKAAGENAAAGKASAAAAVFVVRAKDAAAAGGEEKKKRPGSQEPAAVEKPLPVVMVPSAPVRTSSCTKEEVDAILIQCGRLSRSSSGTGRAASSEAGGGHRRRRSGSKRSYDFDQDARSGGADEDWERQGAAGAVSRPSPHRGSPQRKRSGSRERSSGGGGGSGSRRASRSPGRRTDGAAASVATAGSGGGERARQQPGKMVSVPAREKGRAPSPAAASGKRCASPRSSSPARMAVANENVGCGTATGPTPALSRSSSRKAEQSPYRRNPMAELDENSLRNNSNHSARPQKKSAENAVAATPKKKAIERCKEPAVASSCRAGMEKPEIAEDATVAASETRAPSSKTTATRTASIVADSLSQRPAGHPGSRSRRSSRDFDQNPGSYTTQRLEDIQSYHQQSTSITVPATPATPSFSLPACVVKACSIVEAVADLNSSSSENRTHEYEPGLSADDKGSVNAPLCSDDGVEPSAARKHAHPTARDFLAETEPQESAGSNSVTGHPWTPSWEPTSVESTDRTWSTGDEVVEQSGSHGARCSPMNRPRQSKQRSSQPEPSGRSRTSSGNGNTLHRGRSAHRGSSSVASGRSGVRVVSAAQ